MPERLAAPRSTQSSEALKSARRAYIPCVARAHTLHHFHRISTHDGRLLDAAAAPDAARHAVANRSDRMMSQAMSKEMARANTGSSLDTELAKIDALWRAANYLSIGQIYLLDNPLLKKPLAREHIKPRLLGHWGTTPGLNFIYAHLNRVIKQRDLNVMFVTGPGHGGPALLANTWLEGSYPEVRPDVDRD